MYFLELIPASFGKELHLQGMFWGAKNNFLSLKFVLQPHFIPKMSNADARNCVENREPMERTPK